MKKLFFILILIFTNYIVEAQSIEQDSLKLSEDLKKYIRSNLKYPEEAKKKGIQGSVYVSFTIDTTGNVIKAQIKGGGINPLLENEALRVINTMPPLNPATLDGKPVQIKFIFPIKFSLNN
jgi:TonB family protein